MKSLYFIFFIFFNAAFLFSQEKLEVFFDFNKYDINAGAKEKLEAWILVNKETEVIKLYGFCDWKGENKYNDTLSLKRINAVYDFFINHNINIIKNFEVKGFGEDFKQSKVQAENRKVIVFYKKKIPAVADSNAQATEKTLSEKVKEAKAGDKLLLKNIYFKNRSAYIVPASKPVLMELLCVLEENPNLKIQIQGHICCQLVSDHEDISTARAKAIFNFLVQNKIEKSRLSYKGFGITRPIHPIPEKTEQEADENRRVEIMIVAN